MRQQLLLAILFAVLTLILAAISDWVLWPNLRLAMQFLTTLAAVATVIMTARIVLPNFWMD